MTPKRSEQRFDQGGKVRYLVYESDQPVRGGGSQPRTRVKRFYLPADSRDISITEPRQVRKRTGRSVNGVEVQYEHLQAATTARRGQTSYKVPARWAQRTKVLELPASARKVKLTTEPPEEARQAVA